MSKSDAQRRSYLADQMTMGERMDELERRISDLESSGTTRAPKPTNPGMTHFVGDSCPGGHQPSPTECGRIVVDANEWDRLNRLEKRVLEFAKLELHGVTFNNAETWNAWLAVTRELK